MVGGGEEEEEDEDEMMLWGKDLQTNILGGSDDSDVLSS
jgi:hypothetical protein